MKAILPIACLLIGVAAGFYAGNDHGRAETLQAQFQYQSGLMAAMAEEVHPTKRR